MKYADAMAFFALAGYPPVLSDDLSENNLTLAHVTTAPPFCRTHDEILFEHMKFRKVLEKQEKIHLVTYAKDLDAEGIKVVMGLQHPPIDTLDFRRLCDAGIRVMQIVYDTRNIYGAGFAETYSRITCLLTEKGGAFVSACEAQGLILDLSHASQQLAYDIIVRIADHGEWKLPIMVSHSGVYEIYTHPRNLPAECLVKVAENGGVIGIPNVTFFLDAQDDTLDAFTKHVYWALEWFGEDAVVIGSDGHYACYLELELRNHYAKMKEVVDENGIFVSRYPYQPLALNTPQRMDVLASRLHFLSDRVKEKLFYGNLYRFFKENLPK